MTIIRAAYERRIDRLEQEKKELTRLASIFAQCVLNMHHHQHHHHHHHQGVDQVSINLCSMCAEHASPSVFINFCSSSHIQCLHNIRHHHHYEQVHVNLCPISNIQYLHYQCHQNHHYYDQRFESIFLLAVMFSVCVIRITTTIIIMNAISMTDRV